MISSPSLFSFGVKMLTTMSFQNVFNNEEIGTAITDLRAFDTRFHAISLDGQLPSMDN